MSTAADMGRVMKGLINFICFIPRSRAPSFLIYNYNLKVDLISEEKMC